MATYPEQLEVAQSYRVAEGGSIRGDCPFCSGRNTYSVARRNGVLLWGCFRASCGVQGRNEVGLSIQGIKSRLDPVSDDPRGIPIPPLSSIETQDDVVSFLKTYNAWEAYEQGLIPIKYGPTVDRVMFPTSDRLGYTGRGRKGVKPKWVKFGDCSKILSCGIGKTAVVVEDALSACAVGIIDEFTGCSLSGTLLTPEHIVQLREYDRIMVALDPDAMQKGLQMTARLGSKATLRLIEDDLKYFGKDGVWEQLMGDD